MLKLVSITFETTPLIAGLRAGVASSIDCANPHGQLLGWKAVLRGPALFLVSPKGWKSGVRSHEWDPKGPRVMHEIPRIGCYFQWHGEDTDIETVITKGKFDSLPFGPPFEEKPVVELGGLLSQLDPSQMGDP